MTKFAPKAIKITAGRALPKPPRAKMLAAPSDKSVVAAVAKELNAAVRQHPSVAKAAMTAPKARAYQPPRVSRTAS